MVLHITTWIVSVKNLSSLAINIMGFLFCVIRSQVYDLVFVPNSCFPTPVRGCKYSFESTDWHTAFGVFGILFGRGFPQIAQPVVSAITIDVVKPKLWPLAMHPKPNDAVVFVSLAPDLNPQIFPYCLANRAAILFGNQVSSLRVVVIQLMDICLGKGKIFSSHINSFSVVVVRSLKVLQDYWGFVILYANRGVSKKMGLLFTGSPKSRGQLL
jgi:hypothetical protein